MPTVARINVVAGIIEDGEGSVLLAQRPTGKRLAGLWEFPGGKLEPGESATEALSRELKEELHLFISIQEDLGAFDFDYEWGAIRLFVFVVRAENAPQASEDVQVFEWVKCANVKRFALAPADEKPWSCYCASRPTTQTV